MAKHILLLLNNSVEGKDAEFNDWYDNTHLADVLREAGFTRARRYTLAKVDQESDYRYAAIYEVETDDPADNMRRLLEGTRAGKIPLTPALDLTNLKMIMFEQITERTA